MDKTNLNSDTYMEVVSEIQKLFIDRRNELNLKVRELGEKANVSYTVIYDLEQRGVLPKIETIIKIANALGYIVNVKKLQGNLTIAFNLCDNTSCTRKELKKSVDEQINKLLTQKGLHAKDIEEVQNFIDFRLSQQKLK